MNLEDIQKNLGRLQRTETIHNFLSVGFEPVAIVANLNLQFFLQILMCQLLDFIPISKGTI